MKKLLYLIPILALLQASSFAQNPDSLKKVCEYDTFPVGAIRYLPGDTIVKMFGMNFTWYAWGYAGTPLGHPQQASIREFSGIATRDPFYKDTNATITTTDHNSIFWTAAYGKDIRVYLPGTSGITSEYTFGWNTKSGNLISPSDPEWRIDTTGLHSGDYVLRDLGSVLSDPYTGSAANHRRSFSYDFVYFFKPAELSGISSGTTALYSLEYWVKKSTDTDFIFYLADTINKNSYNALSIANTQVAGRTVGAEKLSTWFLGQSNSYRLQKHILRIDTFYVGDTAPQVDVRLRNFQQIPIYVRCLRIRDWVAQRLLSAKADSLMNLVIDVVKSHDGNDSIKSWSVGNEPFPPTFHCFAYLNDLFVKRSAPPLNVLAPTNPPWDYSLFTRVERDQSENITGKAKMFLWDEELISQGPQWRSWSVDTTYHPQKASWYWDEGYFPVRPLPINFTSDSAEWYHRGVYTESNYTKFTNQWQNNIIGFPSEAVEGGRGMMRDKLNIAKSCYELDPLHPVPYWGCYQAGASQYFIPIWSVDSEKIALNKSTAWADSVYEARIVNPYVNRHPGEILVVDSLYHLFYKWRASSEAEMRFQLWAGIHAGLKGYILNMAFDDMGNNDGILWDTGGVIVKSYDRTEMRFDNSSDGSHKLISPYTGRYFRNGSTYKQKSTLLPGFKGMFNAVRNTITNELGPIATTLGKLSWKGLLSWHKRDSIPTYLQRLPVKNVTAKSLSGMTDADSATYVNFGIHKLSTDTTALYVSIQNRRLWSDPLDTLTTDYRTIAFQVDSTKFPEGDQKFRLFSISDVAGKLRDTIISTRDTFLFTVKPGQGKLFRISPATELTLGRMSTNLYNNARHVAPVEDSTGVKKYVATYARDGKVVVSYPTEVSEGAVHRKAATPVDSVIDGTGDRINPAIGYNPNTGKIGLIYASVSSGATVDTNFIWYRHSSYRIFL